MIISPNSMQDNDSNQKGGMNMIRKICKGMIFNCEDRVSTKDSRHNYLVLNNYSLDNPVARVQCVTITSMANKTVSTEIPIELCNGAVSYVVPYNIYSMFPSDFDPEAFKGIVTDDSILTANDFFKLILDLYRYSITGVDDSCVINRYNDYCLNFWKSHQDTPEYKDVKLERFLNREVSSFENNVVIKNKKEKEPDTEADEIKGEVIKSDVKYEPELSDMELLDNAPAYLKFWKQEHYQLFMSLYAKYDINTLLSKSTRWSTASALCNAHKNCVEYAKKRKFNITINPNRRPLAQWTNDEMETFMKGYETANNKMDYCHFNTLPECTSLYKSVYNRLHGISEK